jgi:hypothetical protein
VNHFVTPYAGSNRQVYHRSSEQPMHGPQGVVWHEAARSLGRDFNFGCKMYEYGSVIQSVQYATRLTGFDLLVRVTIVSGRVRVGLVICRRKITVQPTSHPFLHSSTRPTRPTNNPLSASSTARPMHTSHAMHSPLPQLTVAVNRGDYGNMLSVI